MDSDVKKHLKPILWYISFLISIALVYFMVISKLCLIIVFILLGCVFLGMIYWLFYILVNHPEKLR